jgi:hypothetical protein
MQLSESLANNKTTATRINKRMFLSYTTAVTAVLSVFSFYRHFHSPSPIGFSVFLLVVYTAPFVAAFFDFKIDTSHGKARGLWNRVSTVFFGVNVSLFMASVLLHLESTAVVVGIAVVALALAAVLETLMNKLHDKKE